MSSTITVHCNCGKRLKAPASAVGRKAKCPSCGNVMFVEAPAPEPVAVGVDEHSDEPYDFSDLDELAASEAKAAAVAEANDQNARCANCSMVMSRTAAICVNCGYDVRKGKVLTTAKVAATKGGGGFLGLAKKTEPKKDKLAPQGPVYIGILLSIVFAVVASLPWFIVTYMTDRDFYILEVLVGVAAGFGMQVGQKGYSTLGGILAAATTFVVLIGTRIVLVIAVLAPMVIERDTTSADVAAKTAEQREIDDRDPRVATLLARQELQAQNIDTESYNLDEPSVKKVEAAQKRAEEKVRKMTREEYVKMLPKVEDYEIRRQLIGRQIDPEIRSMGLNPDFQRVEEHNWAKARASVTKRVDAMTPAQQRAELKKLDDQAIADLHAELTRAKASNAAAPEVPESKGVGFFVGLMLVVAIMPLIFLLLSMAAAFKTAAGSVSG